MINNEQNPQLTIPRVIGCLSFFNADNLEIMRGFYDNEFDLAIVDPPYGLGKRLVEGGKKGGMGSLRKLADSKVEGWDEKPTEQYFTELKRISKNQIIWGGNYFLDYLGSNDGLIIWDKMNGTNALADAEIAWKSLSGTTRIFRMHHFSAGYEDKIHPTQKPTKLYEWLLNKYANENDKIIDTHLGSGSIAIAIEKANRLDKMNLQFVGIEIDKEYFEKALNRIEQYCRQGTLSF